VIQHIAETVNGMILLNVAEDVDDKFQIDGRFDCVHDKLL
jgi:hypothetical protein